MCQIHKNTYHTTLQCWHIEEEIPNALATLKITNNSNTGFHSDSGAKSHMKNDPGNIYNGKDAIYVANENSLPIPHISITSLKTRNSTLNINKILLVLGLKKNLLSVSQLTKDNDCTLNSHMMVL